MISFHFPPISASSGYLRVLKFAKYLPQFNFNPIILTANSTAYEFSDSNNNILLEQIDDNIPIYRSWALDTRRHLAIKGKYISWLALPDPWVSWIPSTLIKSRHIFKRHKVDAVWATYPIASALVIGYMLAKLYKKPLFIDLRDPVWEEETWHNSLQLRMLRWIESKVIHRAKAVIFTSPGTIKKYKKRYPQKLHNKFHLIENGFDETDFESLPVLAKDSRKIFLHSGLLPRYERDPECFFQALADLKQQNLLDHNKIAFRFRATGNDDEYQQRVIELGIDDIVEFKKRKDYRYALAEMFSVDVLMIFQHRTCDWQIPAKLFEYFRAGKPVLMLAGENSDTITIANQANCPFVSAEIDDVEQIKSAIITMLQPPPTNTVTDITRYSRRQGAAKVATLIKSIDN